MPFPFNNFTCCFTLFSKCFSSFHHCTCSLSVSRLYLALDGIYHPLWAAFPNNSTRRERLIRSRGPCRTGFSPSVTSCSKEHRHGRLQDAIFKLQLPGGISNLSFCRFTRRYWGNPCWFLFLRLLICLSSAGSPTWFEEKKWVYWRYRFVEYCRHYFRANTIQSVRIREVFAQTSIPLGIPNGAMCVQRFDDSESCDSYYVSHFAAFFIDARTKRSVVESFKNFL